MRLVSLLLRSLLARAAAAWWFARPIILPVTIAGLCLTGCVSLTTPSQTASVTPSQNRPYHNAIDLSGRMSLRYEQHGQDQAIDSKFRWLQTSASTRITLQTPFGQTLAIIEVTPQGATLLQAGHALRSATSVDMLTANILGWPLPVAGLRDWLQGFAIDDQSRRYVASADAARDAAYVKTADGWLIHYPVWEPIGNDSSESHPKRIDLQKMTQQAGKVALRIVLDQWQPQ